MLDCQPWCAVIAAAGFITAAIFGYLLYRERKRNAESTDKIARMAYHDALTELPNRLLFMDRAAIALAHARRSSTNVAVAFIDLDRFKIVNDSCGHHVGDEVLRSVAGRLRDHLREGDTVARIGGDEFTLLMPGLRNDDDVVQIASKLLDVFHLPLRVAGREVLITGSIGLSIFPTDGSHPEDLLKKADTAMYRAKARGGDSFHMYTPALDEHAREELETESRLRLAVARQEFVLHYQPRVDTVTSRVVAFEALLRWNDPERGLIMPRDFMRSAEVSGLIIPIGHWVLRAACRQIREWHDSGCADLVVSVNLSPRQFYREDLTTTIRDALDSSAIDPRFLELEIDESCVMNNAEASMRVLQRLKNLGVRVLISHFGAGYSSLQYLRRFPIDGLKLDRSFLAGNDQTRTLAAAALGMAKALSLKIIGDGVETQEVADFLRARDCDDIQGYFVSAPVPPQECSRFVALAGPRLRRNEAASVPD